MSKPFVYIASPYTKGDPAINVRFQMETWDRLMSDGLCWPIAPLWSHFQHIHLPRPYKDWVEYDLALIPRLDACLRLPAVHGRRRGFETAYVQHDSSGADGEVARFRELGKPVFFNINDEFLNWCVQFAKDNP